MRNSIPHSTPYLCPPYVQGNAHLPVPQNRFVYINPTPNQQKINTKVLVNPHFQSNSKKVYVNPNFSSNSVIHINPSIIAKCDATVSTTVHINPNFQKIHINPRILQTVPTNNVENTKTEAKEPQRRAMVSTRTKLIRAPLHELPKRRNSVKSKFKIVKSNYVKSPTMKFSSNRFKLDNRQNVALTVMKPKKKYVYVNRFVSKSDLAKSKVLRQCKISNLVNISGILYKTSPNTLRKAVIPFVPVKKTKSVYKFVKKSPSKKNITSREQRRSLVTKRKIIRVNKAEKNKKLKKCNIPCPYYRKYGLCKGKDNGKCNRKHDPAQIALCTKFLQGACVNESCLLSHNVSKEKMPTCKYYLEGSCSKENCPYLHVKISPKADICRDFLEGFCQKAAECGKRHQLLCPDFEKHGKCSKQRCPYPHGKMVRKYQVNFAKKCSKNDKKEEKFSKFEGAAEKVEKSRYYVENNIGFDEKEVKVCENIIGVRARPKLGELPSFIPFGKS